MLPKKAISTLISELNGRIPPPVHTAGIEEERPVPAVLVENVDIDNHNHHNSNYAGSEYDSAGNEISEIHRYYYGMRIQLVVKDDDEIGAYDILGQLQQALGELSQRPHKTFHSDVNELRILGSGPISYQFHEPTETEISQAIRLETFYETSQSDGDVIETLQKNISNS